MIDLVKLLLKAGNGGHGRVSFRREKYVPKGGPNGGQGGNGGSLIIRATTHKNTLGHLAGINTIEAEAGQAGSKKQQTGRKGESTVVEVPVGTIIWQIDSNQIAQRRELPDGSLREPLKRKDVTFEFYEVEKETERIPVAPKDQVSQEMLDFSLKNIDLDTVEKKQLAILQKHGQEILLCQGGFGGRGNESFKSPSRTTPLLAECGTNAEQRLVLLELQLLADVGLVGLPNAGKSTFMGRVTKANPRVDSYPFTTLEPQLGVWANPSKSGGGQKAKQHIHELILADIPGLIEGASKGQGLGYQFLRHVKACNSLLFLLAPDEDTFGKVQSGEVSTEELISKLKEQYELLRGELQAFDAALLQKNSVVCINKIDLLPERVLADIRQVLNEQHLNWHFMSGGLGMGTDEVFGLLSN